MYLERMAIVNAGERLKAAFAHLRTVGLDYEWRGGDSAGGIVDGDLTVAVEEVRHQFRTTLRSQLRPSTLASLLAQATEFDLVVSEVVTKTVGAQLRKAGLNYLDTRGNAYLRRPGLFVLVEGSKADVAVRGLGRGAPSRLVTPAALPVVLAVLVRPELVNGPTRELAGLVSSSVGTVHTVLRSLRERGCAWDERSQKLIGGRAVLDLWTDEFASTGRDRLTTDTFRSELPVESLTGRLGEVGAVSGEAAADLQGRSIRPESVECYRFGSLAPFVRAGRLRRVPAGNVTIRQAFWDEDLNGTLASGTILAPSVVVRADLLAVGDPRLATVAQEMMTDDPVLRRLT